MINSHEGRVAAGQHAMGAIAGSIGFLGQIRPTIR
jgi:hypothetical protein